MKYFLLLSLLLFASAATMAQCPDGSNPLEILKNDHPFKIQAVNGVTSSTARAADYVEFKTMENIYSKWIPPVPAIPATRSSKETPEIPATPPAVLFAKDTSIFGVVTRRKHRHFPFVGGKLELELEPLITWNRQEIQMGIARHGPIHNKAEADESDKERKARNNPCKDIDPKTHRCVAGRRNASVSPVVAAAAGAGSGVVTAVAGDSKTRFIAATAFFSLAKDVGDLLNGSDAEIAKEEIFDLYITTPSVCKMPEPPKPKEEKK